MTTQIQIAETLGANAYTNGLMAAPAQNPELMDMIKGRKVGQTPEGEHSTIKLMKAYTEGWNKMHRAEMKKRFGF